MRQFSDLSTVKLPGNEQADDSFHETTHLSINYIMGNMKNTIFAKTYKTGRPFLVHVQHIISKSLKTE